MKEKEEVLEFYKQTSCFTDLGLYNDFVKNLPDDINELCMLQRHQIIHPFIFKDVDIRNKKDCYWGDMTKIPIYKLEYEDDIFPTAQSIFAELLRRNSEYSHKREAKDKIHATCREQAILLTSTLKAKKIPSRCRSGFAFYVTDNNTAGDHWITEYYNEKQQRWMLVDADMHDPDHDLGFDINDIPRKEFIFGAEAYLGLRNRKYNEKEIYYASDPITYGMKASLRALFYDFHSLMNDEVIFLHVPKYICDKHYKLNKKELKELDYLANLMLEPNKNFDKLEYIWKENIKFRIMQGGLNG